MKSAETKKAFVALMDAAKREKADLLTERGHLENELEKKIEAIEEIERQIQQLENLFARSETADAPSSERPLAGEKSFTNAVAFVLKGASRPLSPVEIKTRLVDLGFDSSGWKTDLVSSVHTILKRFLASGPPKVKESGEPRRKVYQWNWEVERTPGLD
jgi:hypothetical protein